MGSYIVANLFRHPAAIIRWLDAHARQPAVEYTDDEARQLHRGEPITTLGLIFHEDEHGVSIYNENTGPDSVRGLSFIPAAMIVEIIYLGQLKKPRTKKAPTDAQSPFTPPAGTPSGLRLDTA